MTTKCCETCRDDFAKEQGYSDERTAVCAWCKCHASPVSEVIAEMTERMLAAVGSTVALQDAGWRTSAKQLLTAGFEKVASVAREEGMNQSDLEEIYKNKIEFGAQAMKEKILAALNTSIEGIGMWQTSPQSYQGLSEAIKLITDLK